MTWVRDLIRASGLYLIVFATGAAFVLGSYRIDHHSFWHHFTRDIGIACLVAFIVIVTIEQRQRREQNQEIRRFLSETHEHLFSTILGVEFPGEVWKLLVQKVMKEKFFRKDTHVFYKLSDPAEPRQIGGIDVVTIQQVTSMEVVNLTGDRVVFPARFFVERLQGPDHQPVLDRKPDIEVSVDGIAIAQSEMKAREPVGKSDEIYNLYEFDVEIGKDDSKIVKMRDYPRDKLVVDSEMWRSVYVCDGLFISITFPDTLEVDIDAIHPDPIEILYRSDTMITARIERPLLPHNGVAFWWSRRAAVAAPAAREPEEAAAP
ncbi:hypothetical protein [Methylobacterium oxalidis]|uniref:Uncharacterized protein n=1 Tax=Methylobacterium oxalidis TaxID=944322 RepID=A0A512J9F3_9HYPH|nr:hypothetical protein [Methylobacterium oxalidis]GEP06587.1 hypothetical protein MOX02_46250 [Methylobacterium oxalidis]GJE33323.1 hypothetical protein LDDCCGHA_3523 [Methylobacterium oxalidis]GLS67240.1 hypothetical protein GCM10007888_56230 [Methylobacterium oxalidis]